MTQAINSAQALYRLLPAMDSLLLIPQVISLSKQYGKSWVKKQLTYLLNAARQSISQQQQLPLWCHSADNIVLKLTQLLQQKQQHSLTPVINLTGTILHTNLGRSQLCEAAIDAVVNVMRYPVPLEFDMGQGKRGHRDSQIAAMINELTGAEDCCIVNNNAAAVLLMLASVASGKEVIVSRGELVEIGGAFRIPDIMAQAGCKLVEVGCTNRTHLDDYQAAINENTAAIMKVHTSNYHIQGFTAAVAEAELAKLCQQHHLLMLSDLGSGALVDLSLMGLAKEPMPQEMLNAGVNLVSFSGDKLLGGPQAGIIVGDKHWIAKLQSHPLKRALRCDKMTLAALEATLQLYRQPDSVTQHLPIFNKLSRSLDELEQQGQELLQFCEGFSRYYSVSLQHDHTQVGSGSQPHILLDSMAICFKEHKAGLSISQLDKLLKSRTDDIADKPIIGRLQNGALYLDLRGIDDHQQLCHLLAMKATELENKEKY